jgi:hypothetical protein
VKRGAGHGSRTAVPQALPARENKAIERSDTPDQSSPQVQKDRAVPELQPARVTELEAAISRITRALGSADDDDVAGLVAERKAMREELKGLRDERDRASLPNNVVVLNRGKP